MNAENTTAPEANRNCRRARALYWRRVAKATKAVKENRTGVFDEDAVRAKLMHRFRGNSERTDKVLAHRRAVFERRNHKANTNAPVVEQSAAEAPTAPAPMTPTTTKLSDEEKLRQILLIKFDNDEAKLARVMSRRIAQRSKRCETKSTESDDMPQLTEAKSSRTGTLNFEERMAAREQKLRAILTVQLDGDLERINRIMAKRKANIARIVERRGPAKSPTSPREDNANVQKDDKEDSTAMTTDEPQNVPRRAGRRLIVMRHKGHNGHPHGRRGHHNGRRGHHTGPHPAHCEVPTAAGCPSQALPVEELNTTANNTVATPASSCRRHGGSARVHVKGRARHGRHLSHFHAHHLPKHQRYTRAAQEAPMLLA